MNRRKCLSKEQGKKVGENHVFPSDSDGNIIPGIYKSDVGEVKIRKMKQGMEYDVINFSRSMNDNFATRTRELFAPEVDAVNEALNTGIYISWRPIDKPWNVQDCQRISTDAYCFCGHMLSEHQKRDGKQHFQECTKPDCVCRAYKFVPSRPAEVGEFWLNNRPDFDPKKYRVKCKCKHTHEEHTAYPIPHRCLIRGCGCTGFTSAFRCAACDKSWHEHVTVFETEKERQLANRPIGEAWYPFAELPELSKIVLTGVDNPNIQTLADALPVIASQRTMDNRIQVDGTRVPTQPGPSNCVKRMNDSSNGI